MKRSPHFFYQIQVFVLISYVFFISCEPRPAKDAQTNEKAISKMQEHMISIDEAFKMYDAYTANRVAILRDTLHKKYGDKFYDTRTVYFDIETLENYIAYVKNLSKEKEVNPEGFKICFGVYSNSGEYANHQNVFIVPTTKKDDRQAAYTIAGGKVQFLSDVRGRTDQKMNKAGIFSFNSMVEEGLILNFGRPIPPPYINDPDF